jgi:hypothetical protein
MKPEEKVFLDAWRINERVTTFLVEHIPPGLWDASLPRSPRLRWRSAFVIVALAAAGFGCQRGRRLFTVSMAARTPALTANERGAAAGQEAPLIPPWAGPTWPPERRADRPLPPCTKPRRLALAIPPRRVVGVRAVKHPPCVGVQVLEALIDTTGSVESVTIPRGGPLPLSEECVVEAMRVVRGWRFEPAVWVGPPSPGREGGCMFLPGDAMNIYLTLTVRFQPSE